MPCFYPIRVYAFPGEAGKQIINFQIPRGKSSNLSLPCNKCLGCKLEYSRQWAVRCMHESMFHDVNCFITLTYDDYHQPRYGSLKAKDLTNFWKRLRKEVGKLRYYACGEYGEKSFRPHYHACVFGYRPDDGILIKPDLFYSEFLAGVWGNGHCSFGDLTFESAAYVARYVAKKLGTASDSSAYQYIDRSSGEVFEIEREFCRMSRRPGIGHSFFTDYSNDMYSGDSVIMRGRPVGKPSRYYDKLLELSDNDLYTAIKERRREVAEKADPKEQSDQRLRARAACADARTKLKQRKL